jgi:hypothetical protein
MTGTSNTPTVGGNMPTHLVGYDLRTPGRNYDGLIEYLKGLGGWWHCLDSTWFVKTTMTASELRDKINTFVDRNDLVLVMNVATRDWATTGMSKDCNDWLRNNL